MIHAWADGNPFLDLAIRVWIVASVFLPLISLIAMFCIWWERKTAGHIQSRVGPVHVGGRFGWLQSLADGVKLVSKEDLIPTGADHLLFRLAPYLAFAPVFAAFVALPFGPQWCFEPALHIGVLYLLAVLAVEVMGTMLAGWGSNSKWSIYGAMREACQMVSYEIPLGLAIICGVLTAGTLNLVSLNYLQGGGMMDWFLYHNPFIFATFFIYYIASLASTKRAPFDLPESESELVAGYHTEYSGIRWSFFFFGEYGSMFVVGAIQAMLFLGGWNSPLGPYDPIYAWIGFDPLMAGEAHFTGAIAEATTWGGKAEVLGLTPMGLIALNLYCAAWFVFKALTIIFVQIWIRWTLPRIRIDQVLYTCVKVLLPAGLVCLVGVAVWVAVVPQPAVPTSAHPEAQEVLYLGHLLGESPLIQSITQWTLLAINLAMLLSMIGVIIWAWLHRDRMPRKSLFTDIMPVGRDVPFTTKYGP